MKNYVRLFGSVILVTLVASRLDWPQLGQAFAALDVRYWAAAVLAYLLAQVISSLRWQLLARPLGFHFAYLRYLALYFVGMFFNLVLPTSVGGDVVRAWYLGGPAERRGAAFLTVVADRGSGLAVLIVLACVSAFLVPTELPRYMKIILASLGGSLLLGVAGLPYLRLLARLPKLGARFARLDAVARTYIQLPSLLLITAGLSLLVQLASVAQYWLVAKGLGLDVSFGYLAVAIPLVTLLTQVPISLNGMGLRELGLVVLLGPVGVSSAEAVTLSLLGFAANVTASLAGAGVYLAGPFPRYSRGKGVPDNDASLGRDSDQGREGQPAPAA